MLNLWIESRITSVSIDLELPRGYEVDTALKISLQAENTLSWYLDQLDTPPKQRCLLQKHSRTVIKISRNVMLVPQGGKIFLLQFCPLQVEKVQGRQVIMFYTITYL